MQHFSYQRITGCVVLVFLIVSSTPTLAQSIADGAASIARKVSFREYLEAVEQNNLDLQSQRENITSAKAGVSIAGVRPDPQFTAGISSLELNPANRDSEATATTAGIAVTIETAGKRGKRIRAAEGNVRLTEANVGDFLRQLDLDAASAFVEVCRAREALKRKQSSLKSFQAVVLANETRFKVGDIGMLELRKSRVEADRYATEVTSTGADASVAVTNLSVPLGKPIDEIFPQRVVDCELKTESLRFELESLLRQALENRHDVQVAKAAVDTSRANLELARANRWVDPTVNVGLIYTPQIQPVYDGAGNVINQPTLASSSSLGLTVTVPIPFSRLQRGELIQAETALKQAQLQLRSVLLKAETEVRATYTQYQAAFLNIRRYSEHVLTDAEHVLEAVRISYRKGAASLLDLLDAQRTADDVYLNYLQALAVLANTTVKLQLSAGMRADL